MVVVGVGGEVVVVAVVLFVSSNKKIVNYKQRALPILYPSPSNDCGRSHSSYLQQVRDFLALVDFFPATTATAAVAAASEHVHVGLHRLSTAQMISGVGSPTNMFENVQHVHSIVQWLYSMCQVTNSVHPLGYRIPRCLVGPTNTHS